MLFLGLASLVIGSCLANSTVPESKDKDLARATNDFSFELLKLSKNDKNYFASPLSISTALAMVYLGTEGTTSEVIRRALKYDKYQLTETDVHETFRKLQKHLDRSSQDYQLNSFNKVLVQKDFIILHIYGHALQLYYSAEIESVDFENEGKEIQSKINDAVSNATRGKIQNFLVSPPSVNAKLNLLNAVYFLGNWEHPFSPNFTYTRTFYNNGVQEVKVPMMHRDAQYQYAASEELGASLVVLPYKGGNASMIIVLPDEKTGVAEVQQKISQSALDAMLASTGERRLQLKLPKFSLSYSKDLVEPLTSLGLGEIFGNGANFGRLAAEGSKLKVSSVLQKAVIEVNERGSLASAATGIEIIPLSIPPVFDICHPFLIFIRDEQTGMILFHGRVDQL